MHYQQNQIHINSFPQTKWPPFGRRYFQMHFRAWNVLYFVKISLKFVLKGPIDNKSVLVQVIARRRTGNKPFIIWTDADRIHWRIYVALGGDEMHPWQAINEWYPFNPTVRLLPYVTWLAYMYIKKITWIVLVFSICKCTTYMFMYSTDELICNLYFHQCHFYVFLSPFLHEIVQRH